MKMVKSLLLGSAAGVVAVAGAQAADLPVKAKPVQYVKICTLYGDGFYYIPGSDTCIKFAAISGRTTAATHRRPHAALHGRCRRAGSHRQPVTRPGIAATSRSTPARRPPTARCGRSRASTPKTTEGTANARHAPRVHPVGRLHLRSHGVVHRPRRQPRRRRHALALHRTQYDSTTGATGINQIAYTWQLGNGITLNVGADERRVASRSPTLAVDRLHCGRHRSDQLPSRHLASRSVGFVAGQPGLGPRQRGRDRPPQCRRPTTRSTRGGCPCAQTGTTQCGYPDDKWGWAVLAGAEIKLDMLSPGSRVGFYGTYGVGAVALRRRQQPDQPGPVRLRQPGRLRRPHRRGLRQRRRAWS